MEGLGVAADGKLQRGMTDMTMRGTEPLLNRADAANSMSEEEWVSMRSVQELPATGKA
jgi:hypothetical protein